jgi:site-specific recombinase XerD
MKRPPEPLTVPEVELLLGACGRAPTGVRHRALLTLLWRTGLRISEALALEPRDVDLEGAQLRVRHGKGDRCRVVGLDPRARRALQDWTTTRVGLDPPQGAPVFCGIRNPGARLNPGDVRDSLHALGRRAGIAKPVRPHGLRHTMACELAAEGVPVNVIQRALGHSSVATTHTYLNHVAPQEVLDCMRSRA